MNFSYVANEVIDELADKYDYKNLGVIAYHQMITDLANYAFEEWKLALFVSFEDVIEEEVRRRGFMPNE